MAGLVKQKIEPVVTSEHVEGVEMIRMRQGVLPWGVPVMAVVIWLSWPTIDCSRGLARHWGRFEMQRPRTVLGGLTFLCHQLQAQELGVTAMDKSERRLKTPLRKSNNRYDMARPSTLGLHPFAAVTTGLAAAVLKHGLYRPQALPASREIALDMEGTVRLTLSHCELCSTTDALRVFDEVSRICISPLATYTSRSYMHPLP